MSTQIHSKDIVLTPHIKAHLEGVMDSFKKYSLDITSMKVDVKKEKNGVGVEFDIHIAHSEPIVINQNHEDLHAAIDLASDRVTNSLRKLHDKIVTHRNTALKDHYIEEN